MLVKGGVSLITRGFGQSVVLEPYLYSVDPDYPEKQYQDMEFRWFCKQESETLPTDPEDSSYLYEGNIIELEIYDQ